MKLTYQREAESFYYRNRAAHDRSGMEETARINASEATYHGSPIKMLYLPKVFTGEGYQFVRDAGETTWKILEKVIRAYLDDPEYRRLFHFPKELEELILSAPHYSTLLPVCRLDMFLNEETGQFKFCEFNADGSSAMNENRIMAEAYRQTEICRDFDGIAEQRYFELFDSWVDVFLRLARETGDTPEKPQVAIVDFLEKSIAGAELRRFAEAFRRAGCEAEVLEIRDLVFDGKHLYGPDGFRVDAIYRRAVTSDVLAHADEVRPFLEAVRRKKVCLIGDFCTQVVHDKILFQILFDRRTRAFLTEEENRFVVRHVPYTLEWTSENAKKINENGRRWILKQQDSYGAEGVFFSGDHTGDEWRDILSSHVDRGFVLQEYVAPYRTLNADYTDTDYRGNRWQKQAEGAESPYMHSFANMTGMYLYGGRLAGIYSRLSPLNIISVKGDEHEMVSVVGLKR